MKKAKLVGKLSIKAKTILIIIPFLVAIWGMVMGRMIIEPSDVFNSILNKVGYKSDINPQIEIVLWTIRFPRVLLALLVGAGLSVAGCAFQSLFSNPLATPDTLGVASGSSFGAVFAILIGLDLIGIQILALVFGIVAVMLTYIASGKQEKSMNTIVLAGIMIGSLFSALVSLVKFTANSETKLPSITYWLMGSLSSASYNTLILGAPFIIIGTLILFALRWRMNILMLSDDEAKSSGINVTALRVVTIVCATAITGSCVSMCGQVGWVGLLIPHICRMTFGNNHLSLIPASISIGAVFMVIVDTIARSASSYEIPISILTAIIGAPFFIILMRRSGGWQL